MQSAFGGYHPLVNFIFYIAAIGLGMFLIHPAFLAVSAVFSVALTASVAAGSVVTSASPDSAQETAKGTSIAMISIAVIMRFIFYLHSRGV